LKAFKKILIIIQRSNGDVLLSQTLINSLYTNYDSPQIDLLVNDDTVYCASLLTNVNFIHTFSYSKKSENRWKQEIDIFKALNRKYELSINLTASDRSVLYALIASKNSISAIEKEKSKSFWKRILLTHHYFFDTDKHILLNNLEPLNILKIKHQKILSSPKLSNIVIKKLKNRLEKMGITDFIIFHPSAQYSYKIYPLHLRKELLILLNRLGVSILITGSNSKLDIEVKKQLNGLSNIFDLIGDTTLEEYFALSELSLLILVWILQYAYCSCTK
jgi:heptosyltransferase-3